MSATLCRGLGPSRPRRWRRPPSIDQVSPRGVSSEFIQRSHILSLDVTYDLTSDWSLGGKYGFRRAEVSLERDVARRLLETREPDEHQLLRYESLGRAEEEATRRPQRV